MSSKIPWSIAGVLAAICLFLSFSEVKEVIPPIPQVVTKEVVREVPSPPKIITKEVVREVPSPPQIITKEVVREVAAEIPPDYKGAMDFLTRFAAAKAASGDDLLAGVRSLNVKIAITENLRGRISESELKDAIELELRRSGIPVKREQSDHYLIFQVDGLWNDSKVTFSYSADLSLRTVAFVFSEGEPRRFVAPIWKEGYTGLAGSSRVEEGINDASKKLVTQFSNRFLEKNPRQ